MDNIIIPHQPDICVLSRRTDPLRSHTETVPAVSPNKPSNSTTLFSFSVSLSVYFFFTSIFDRSISTSHVSTGQPESAALNSSIKHNLRRQKITKENEDKGRKATD